MRWPVHRANLLNTARELDAYVRRALKGDKPAELPVQKASKSELVTNPLFCRTTTLCHACWPMTPIIGVRGLRRCVRLLIP
jgi:hypothetical protein